MCDKKGEKMKRVRIDRFAYTPGGTFGTLEVYEGAVLLFACRTLERPWENNKANVSCIPAGVYFLKLDNFKGKYADYQLQNVPSRTFIEMHIGNSIADVTGCIALGKEYRIDEQYDKYWITQSTVTFNQFMETMEGDAEAVLEIRENIISTAHIA